MGGNVREEITREVTGKIALQIRDVSAVLAQLLAVLAEKGVLDRTDIGELLERSERLLAEATARSGRENQDPLIIPNLRKILLEGA